MKIIKISLLLLLFLLVGIQFFPTKRNQSDNIPVSDFIQQFNVPTDLAVKLKTSCYDCHSNNTLYPWYNKIQPMAWLLEYHINEAKEELDFSIFGTYSKRKQKSKIKAIFSQIKDDKMPLKSYSLIHKNAKFSTDEKERLLNWLKDLKGY